MVMDGSREERSKKGMCREETEEGDDRRVRDDEDLEEQESHWESLMAPTPHQKKGKMENTFYVTHTTI